MHLNLNPSTSLSSSDKYGTSSSSESNEEMDLSAIIDTEMEVNQDIAFDRVETNHSLEILNEDNLAIDMIV